MSRPQGQIVLNFSSFSPLKLSLHYRLFSKRCQQNFQNFCVNLVYSEKRFYRPTFRMHLTNKEILDKLLSYSEDLKHHYNSYQIFLFHFQNKEPDKFFGLIKDNLKLVHPLFQTVFKTFLKDKEKIVNALQLLYSNSNLEATNNLIKLIKRNAFGFRNFKNFKKRIFIALNIKKERTKCVLSRS